MDADRADFHGYQIRAHPLNPRPSAFYSFSPLEGREAFSGFVRGNTEVAEHIPPDAVDVVGAVLGVVELDQEGRALDAVAVGLVAFTGAEPGEADGFGAGL